MFIVVKLGSPFTQAERGNSGERTSTTPTAIAPVNTPPAATLPKKVVDIEDTPESIVQIE